MSRDHLQTEFVLAGLLLVVATLLISGALLFLFDDDVDPSSVAPAKIAVETIETGGMEAPPIPKPTRSAAPTSQAPTDTPKPTRTSESDRSDDVEDDRDKVKGRVTDRQGAPVIGATISLKKGRRTVVSSTSDDYGQFSVGPPPSGRFNIVATHPKYAKETLSRTSVPRSDVVIVMKEGGNLSGIVLDDWSSEPLSGAAVRVGLKGEAKKDKRRSLDEGTRTDAEGRWSLSGLPAGKYNVAASHRGYAVGHIENVEVQAGDSGNELTIRLLKEVILEGRIVDDANSEPVAKALIVFQPPFPAGPRRARSRPDGTFILKGVSPGRASIKVSRARYMTKFIDGLELSAGESRKDLEIRLQKPGAMLLPEGHPKPELSSALARAKGFQYGGIGAVLKSPKGGEGLLIQRLVPGGAAENAGLRQGDRILEVEGESVDSNSMRRAVNMLRGAEGDTVNIKVRDRDGEVRLIQPIRSLVTFPGRPNKR